MESMSIFEKVQGNFGFGCMRLPMNGDVVDTAQFSAMVDKFMASGFNYFDTAHGYLSGKSETAIAECVVKRYPRESFTLTNKLTNVFFKSEADVKPFFEQQLAWCGVDYFDFYLMHSQSKDKFEYFKRCRAYEQALELKAEGKIKHFGISLQAEDNLATMRNFTPLDQTEQAAVSKVGEILNSKHLIPCTACRYCVDGCPKHISIPDLFACMNAKQLYKDWNADFYYHKVHTKNKGKASDCIRCGKCEKICPQHLPIRNLLQDVAKQFDVQGENDE